MAKISFSKQFAAKRNERLEKLALAQGGRARVSFIGEMEAQFSHTLNKVVLDEDTGRIVMDQKQNKDKTKTYEVPVTEYVGKYVCTGDFEVVSDRGTDAENCVFCKAAEDSGAFQAPRRYMVVLVFQYELKAGQSGFNIQAKPFQGKILPWVFSDGKWDSLAAIDEEYQEDGGVWAMDLLLGPCDPGPFQNFDIQPGRSCEWRSTPERQAYVQELVDGYEGDLSTLFGRKVSPVEADRLVLEVQDQYDRGMNPHSRNTDSLRSSSRAAVDTLFSGQKGDPDNAEGPEEDDDSEDSEETPQVAELNDLLKF